MKALYRFTWDQYRPGGYLDGMFVANEDEVRNLFGTMLYFGNALGVDSDVKGFLHITDIQLLSKDQDLINKLTDIAKGDTICGYNPFDYQEPELDEDWDDIDEVQPLTNTGSTIQEG